MIARILALMLVAGSLLPAPALAQLQMTVKPSLPSLPGEEKTDDKIFCRPPLPQSDSRLPGPETCRPQREWDQLHAQGLDIGADGKSIVASEKYRTLRGQ
jgi:hypothetical protein